MAQVGFKWRLNNLPEFDDGKNLLFEIFKTILVDYWFWVFGIILVASASIWYYSLTKVNLSVAFPLVALSYPIVICLSAMMLNEPVTSLHYYGSAAIVIGVVMVGYAGLQQL